MIETPILKKRAGFCVYLSILGINNQPTILFKGIFNKIKTRKQAENEADHPGNVGLNVSEKGRCTMSKDTSIRWKWLKGMYIYTIIGAGGAGLGIITLPDLMRSIFGWPGQEPIFLGVVGSVYFSFGLLSILGLRSPLKFSPVLLLQLTYKVIWFIGVIIPMMVTGRFPNYAIFTAVTFATYIIGDLIAIPFSYVFAKEADH